MRYREGQALVLFDGKGGRYEAVIDKIDAADGSVAGTLTGEIEAEHPRAVVRLNLYQGLLKSSHWEWVLEKGTEIGVSAFIPVLTPRTVVLLHEAQRAKTKMERWNKIVLAAGKQSRSAALPALREPLEFRDAIRNCQGKGLSLLAWEGLSQATAGQTLRQALLEAPLPKGGLDVNLFIGPEGGFSEEEVELAESVGATIFGMGSKILRSETAALVAASLVLYEFGCL